MSRARDAADKLSRRRAAALGQHDGPRWREEHGTSGSWWTARTAHGTFAIDPLMRGFALDYYSATQPAGVQHLGQFGTMAAAKGSAREHSAAMRGFR